MTMENIRHPFQFKAGHIPLTDPDKGLELDSDFELEIQQSLAEVETGGETIPAHEVAERLGLTW